MNGWYFYPDISIIGKKKGDQKQKMEGEEKKERVKNRKKRNIF